MASGLVYEKKRIACSGCRTIVTRLGWFSPVVFWVVFWGVGSGLQKCKYFGSQQLPKEICLREGLVCLAFFSCKCLRIVSWQKNLL